MAAKQSEFTATEIKAGVLVLVSLLILVGFVAAIRGCRPRDETAKIFYATFTDIGGLNAGAQVRFGGVEAGRVTSIESDPDDRSKIRAAAEVRGDVPVNKGSLASIGQITLTAEKHLEISTGNPGQPLCESGDTIPAGSGGGFIDLPDMSGVLTKLETLLDGVNVLLGVDQKRVEAGEGEFEVANVADLLASLQATADESGDTMQEVRSILVESRGGFQDVLNRLVVLEKSTTELIGQLNEVVAENREPLRESFANIRDFTVETRVNVDELASSLQRTITHLEEVSANSNDLVDARRPAIEEILLNLQVSTRNLKELSRVLSEQPSALIRSKQPQGRTSGEGR
ncbi:MAG: MCE family protein [bacterium]|nr:MCE family protein [bacterium]